MVPFCTSPVGLIHEATVSFDSSKLRSRSLVSTILLLSRWLASAAAWLAASTPMGMSTSE